MEDIRELKPYVDTLIVPIGTVEAHGRHAPLGTDILIPEKLAEMIDSQVSGRVYVAPTINYGHAWGFNFEGTVNIPVDVLTEYIFHSVAPFHGWGIRYVVLLNGHGGNITALQLVTEKLVDAGFVVLLSNWWLDYQEQTRQITPGIGHAGEDETSAVLAIDESLVHMDLAENNLIQVQRGVRYPGIWNKVYVNAASGNAKDASVEKGRHLLQVVASRVVDEIKNLWQNKI